MRVNVKMVVKGRSNGLTQDGSFRAANHHFRPDVRLYLEHSLSRVGVGSLLPAESCDDVDESAVVLDSSSRSAGLLLLLLLLFHFGSLTLDLTGTSQRAVDFASEKTTRHLDRRQLTESAGGQGLLLDERGSIEVEDLVFDLVDSFQLADVIFQGLDGLESRHVDRVDVQISAHEKLHLRIFRFLLLKKICLNKLKLLNYKLPPVTSTVWTFKYPR